jgi:hypothetical protein
LHLPGDSVPLGSSDTTVDDNLQQLLGQFRQMLIVVFAEQHKNVAGTRKEQE